MSQALQNIFSDACLAELFPASKTDAFFDALFGGAEEGAYDISLRFVGADSQRIEFCFVLTQRPEKCLRCSLTYGLPQVFSRHPVLNVAGLVKKIVARMAAAGEAFTWTGYAWELGATQEDSREIHCIPLYITKK